MNKQFIALVMVLVTVSYCELVPAEPNVPKGIITLDGRPAPALQLKDMDGNAYDIRESRGQWVFVHFWASWCGPCRREMPTVQRMASKLEDQPIKFVLVNTSETDDTVFNFLGVVAPDMSTLMDRDGLVTERWQPRGLPASFFVSPRGTLEYIALGGRKWDKPPLFDFVKQVIMAPGKADN
ncbi:MAG: TlpA disulfide reductase family protein [Gammaproteobacteria bacterium]|jgi:thiol-disulfide isomerase/thioredoxin